MSVNLNSETQTCVWRYVAFDEDHQGQIIDNQWAKCATEHLKCEEETLSKHLRQAYVFVHGIHSICNFILTCRPDVQILKYYRYCV